MFFVIRHSGKQYLAKNGDKIILEKIEGNDGDLIDLDVVCAVTDTQCELKHGKIKARILQTYADKKVIVFKKQKRHRHTRKNGHRQLLTDVMIEGVPRFDFGN
jgi:large subunit ribosomal protein L21